MAATLFLAATVESFAATMGFSAILTAESVQVSEQKAVFVVSGPCELLLYKSLDSSGTNAQTIAFMLDHGVIVLYRTPENFLTEKSWGDACQEFAKLFHQQTRMVSTKQL